MTTAQKVRKPVSEHLILRIMRMKPADVKHLNSISKSELVKVFDEIADHLRAHKSAYPDMFRNSLLGKVAMLRDHCLK